MAKPSDRDAKQALIAKLLEQEGIAAKAPTIPRRAPGAATPLSHAQEILWLLDRATPGLIAYNSALAYRLRGPLDVAALRTALDRLVERHESLRTRFEARDESAVQVIDPPSPAHLTIDDLRHEPAATRGARAAGVLRAHARVAFDLTRDHLFRAVVVQLDEQESLLLLVTHHIVSDAWSYGVIVHDLSALYAASRAGGAGAPPAPAIQFGDFAAWERAELTGQRLEERLAFWRESLLPPPPELLLPTDRPRPSAPGFEGGRALTMVPASLLAKLKALAASESATLYMVLVAAYQTVLHRWSEQDDLVTGSAFAARTQSETEGVVGYFSAALPVRTKFAQGESFRSLLGRIRKTVLGVLSHQDVPAEALATELQTHGRPGHAPLFNAVLTMQEQQSGQLALAGIEATQVEVEAGTTKFDLTLLPSERADGLELLLWYRADLFDQATADRFLGHVATTLGVMASDANAIVDDFSYLTDAERAQLATWNATSRDLGAPTTIAALVEAAGAKRTGAALVCGSVSRTWPELLARAHQLAHKLQSLGVGPDVRVGLCLDRSAELVEGMLGILAAGGAYVPLLPDQPPARIAQLIAESGASVIVTSSAYKALLPAGVSVVSLDDDAVALAALPSTAPASKATPEHLAYVLFTSGSTGVPKGVAVTHANLVHYTRAIASVIGIDPSGAGPGWSCATVSTLAADLGHTSVFPALVSGGTLHVLPNDVITDASRFQAYVTAHPIDLLKITPSHFQALVGPEFKREHFPAKWLVFGGEPCSWNIAQRAREAGTCRVLNHYGPTETTVGACTFEPASRDVSQWAPATVPIGSPLPNVTMHVLDQHQHAVPVGVPGELWIGGAGVARGYLMRDELTRERFVEKGGERMYRTGDRVRRLPTGDLEFQGRLDQQVKVRGHRVELGEVEAALARHPSVRQAVVALHDDQLVGYVVVQSSLPIDDAGLVAHVAESLPDYMVPGQWVRLERLPLNANGKVDRKALPAPARAAETATDGSPRTDTERQLVQLWIDVLKKDAVGIHDNFLALGGHSLLAIRMLGRISKTFGVRLPLRTLFDSPTVAQLATEVDKATAARA